MKIRITNFKTTLNDEEIRILISNGILISQGIEVKEQENLQNMTINRDSDHIYVFIELPIEHVERFGKWAESNSLEIKADFEEHKSEISKPSGILSSIEACSSDSTVPTEDIKPTGLLDKFAHLPACSIPDEAKRVKPDELLDSALHHLEIIKKARVQMCSNDLESGIHIIKSLIQRMCYESMDILGKPPCSIAILSAGSFAREEMMPFSDCDLCLMSEDNSATDYLGSLVGLLIFKAKLAVFIANPECKSIAEGFSIDTEFVGTPEKIAKQCIFTQLTLCDAAVLMPDKKLQRRYEDALAKECRTNDAIEVLQICSRTLLDTTKMREPTSIIDIKEDFYRPLTKFVSVLAVCFHDEVKELKNSIARVRKLANKEKLDYDLAKNMEIAIMFVLRMRVQKHCSVGKADDAIKPEEINSEELLHIRKTLMQIHERLDAFLASDCRDSSVFGTPKKKGFFDWF